MGIAYNTSIVRDGLVLHLDAANVKSYPGSGTAWNDLSGNGNNGTLVNGVGYSVDNNGSLIFDGVDDYAQTNQVPQISTTASFEVVVNVESGSPYSNSWIMGREGCYRLTYGLYDIQWVCCTTNNAWYSSGTYVNVGPSIISKFVHIVVTFTGSRLQIYVNGTLANATTTDISGNILSNSNPFHIGKSLAGNVSYGKGKIPLIKCYSKLLSSVEIMQNFEALRGRYGI